MFWAVGAFFCFPEFLGLQHSAAVGCRGACTGDLVKGFHRAPGSGSGVGKPGFGCSCVGSALACSQTRKRVCA